MVDLLGQAAFSRAVQALDAKTGMLVCLKIIKVSVLGALCHCTYVWNCSRAAQ